LRRLSTLYREHYAFVWRVLRRCGVPEADVDDAVQEVFLVVHRRLGDFEGQCSERTWLYAVAVRVASTLRRTLRRRELRRDRAGADLHATTPIDPEDELSRAQAGQILQSLLDELDDKKRTVFVLAELEGVKVPEISRILGVNPRTVYSRLRLARQSFRSAVDRFVAREQGRIRRSSLAISRLRRASDRQRMRPSRAAWAALVVRLSTGAAPILGGWTPTLAAAGTSVFTSVVATAAAALSVVGLTAVLATEPRSAEAAAPRNETPIEMPAVEPTVPSPLAPAVVETPGPVAPSIDPARLRPGPQAEPPTLSEETPRPRSVRRSRPAPAEPDPIDVLDRETELLEQARRRLRSQDPQGALAILDEHQRRYPHGILETERETTIIRALCSGGETERARRRAGEHPNRIRVFRSFCHE
jgi:RNA polymerase sigma-70 factor (ECF subfamily)